MVTLRQLIRSKIARVIISKECAFVNVESKDTWRVSISERIGKAHGMSPIDSLEQSLACCSPTNIHVFKGSHRLVFRGFSSLVFHK
jgi:hypothetical protein